MRDVEAFLLKEAASSFGCFSLKASMRPVAVMNVAKMALSLFRSVLLERSISAGARFRSPVRITSFFCLRRLITRMASFTKKSLLSE